MRHCALEYALAAVADIRALGQGVAAYSGVGADIVRKQGTLYSRQALGLDDEVLLRAVYLVEPILLEQPGENFELCRNVAVIGKAEAVVFLLYQRIVVGYDIGWLPAPASDRKEARTSPMERNRSAHRRVVRHGGVKVAGRPCRKSSAGTFRSSLPRRPRCPCTHSTRTSGVAGGGDLQRVVPPAGGQEQEHVVVDRADDLRRGYGRLEPLIGMGHLRAESLVEHAQHGKADVASVPPRNLRDRLVEELGRPAP